MFDSLSLPRHFVFLLGSTRVEGNSELLAQQAANKLPPATQQTWLRLTDLPLEPFADIRHSVGVYPLPSGNEKVLLEATLAATDLVLVAPLYWYAVPTPLKLYLDYWSAWMRVADLHFLSKMAGKTLWVVCASSGDREEAQPMFDSLKLSAKYTKMRWGGVLWGNGSRPGDIVKDQAALEAAKTFFMGVSKTQP